MKIGGKWASAIVQEEPSRRYFDSSVSDRKSISFNLSFLGGSDARMKINFSNIAEMEEYSKDVEESKIANNVRSFI